LRHRFRNPGSSNKKKLFVEINNIVPQISHVSCASFQSVVPVDCERDLAEKIDVNNVISEFARITARKATI